MRRTIADALAFGHDSPVAAECEEEDLRTGLGPHACQRCQCSCSAGPMRLSELARIGTGEAAHHDQGSSAGLEAKDW